MYRLGFAAVLGCLLLAARPALAQEGSKDDVKKLTADLTKLRAQLNDLESRLQKTTVAKAKHEEKTPAAHWGFFGHGWRHHARMQDKTTWFQKMFEVSQPKSAKGEKRACSKQTSWARHPGGFWTHWPGHGTWVGHHHRTAAAHWAGHDRLAGHQHWAHWAGHGRWAGHHHWAHWAGHHNQQGSDRSSPASVEARLDHIMRELTALRSELHKTK